MMSECLQCKCEVRPQGTSKQDYPGTKVAGPRGYCAACYEIKRKNGDFQGVPRGKRGKPIVRVPRQRTSKRVAAEPVGEAREVLTRVYLTPSTYKTLRRAKVDVGTVLSRVADQLAAEVNHRA